MGKKKVIISCGPIPARLDTVKFITNRFKGGLAFRTAVDLMAREDYELTIVKWVHTPLPDNIPAGKVPVVNVADVFEYYNFFADHAKDYDAFIMAAAVANLTPSHPWEGKFPSHNYKVGEKFNIEFEIAPRAIDVIKKINPRCCLIGYKLFDANTDEELIEIARHTLNDSKSNVIFANTPTTAKTKKIAVMQDNAAIPCTFDEHVKMICQAIDADYFKTIVEPLTPEEAADDDIREALATVRVFEQTFGNGYGTVAVPVKGHSPMFATTSRGHKGGPVIVRKVDAEELAVYASGKATLNAPTLNGILARLSDDQIVVHRHEDDPRYVVGENDKVMPKYMFPGSFQEAFAMLTAFGCHNTSTVRLDHHGNIAVKPIGPVDWDRYYQDFPDRYFSTPPEMQSIIDQYAGSDSLELGPNKKTCAKYAYDPNVTVENAIQLHSWDEVLAKHYDFVVARNSVNYLDTQALKEILAVTDRFVANTFLVPPEEKITDQEAAVLVTRPGGKAISHTLLMPDDTLCRHEFWARTQADYEAMGLKVTPYGHNSALLTKGI